MPRDREPLPLECLDPVLEHGAVDLVQDVAPNPDLEVRANADDVLVEAGVMDLAESQPVWDYRLTEGVLVAEDVAGVQQAGVSKVAHGAAAFVCLQHPGAEERLVEPTLCDRLRVAPIVLADVRLVCRSQVPLSLVKRDYELAALLTN